MKYVLILASVCCALLSFSQNDSTQTGDHSLGSLWKNFELSFGSSVLFLSQDEIGEIAEKEEVVLPTKSILFFTELRSLSKLRVPFYVNLPSGPTQVLVDSVLVNKRANTTGGFGINYECFQFPVSDSTTGEFELGVLSNMTISKINEFKVSPLLTGRFRLVKHDSFVMYIGSSYTLGLNSWAVFYGTGFIF